MTSTRPTRIGGRLGQWVADQISPEEWDVELLDLGALDLPMLDEDDVPRLGNYTRPHTLAWAKTVSEADALIILTPEYNASFTAPLKNAIDTLFAEWNEKPIGVIGYGWGGGARATAALSPVLKNVQADERGVVHVHFNKDIDPAGEVLSDELAGKVQELAAKLV
ncbi:NAD(P)H-dependent oxidoreductase [Falsarthrobacter nasiphocae]